MGVALAARDAGEGEGGRLLNTEVNGTDSDSGREGCCSRGKDGGSGEHIERICENSRVYHSQSDSGSDSSCDPIALCSCAFLNGWRRDAEMRQSSEGGVESALCLVMKRGLMEARRGLKARGDGM